MPRQARMKGEFSTYHIIQRGNDKKEIFLSDIDKRKFIGIMEKMKDKYNFIIYAYCLMDNHIHLLINDNGNDISKLIKSINVSYVVYFNRRYKRCGHLFQNRFISDIIAEDTHLLEVSKYIHNNPVKAKMVQAPEDYCWSSFYAYLNNLSDIVDVDTILGHISNIRNRAISEYKRYVTLQEDYTNYTLSSLLSTPEGFMKENGKFIATIEEALVEFNRLLLEQNIPKEECLRNKEKRNEIIRYLRKNSSLTLKELGFLLGGISESRVSRILNKA